MKRLTLSVAFLAMVIPAQGQQADTTEVTGTLDEVVVTANRSESLRSTSTAAVSVLQADRLRGMPGLTGLADVLRMMPGFAPLHIDGLGYDPQPVIRGFYGGGEAEYVIVLLNGQPLNVMETGLVNWNQIPIDAIGSVEVLRGGASSLFGDAAIGGIINVRTNDDAARRVSLSASFGSHGSYRGSAVVQRAVGRRMLRFFGNLDRTGGYRDHAGRLAASIGASADLFRKESVELSLSVTGHGRQYDVPGPLTQEQIRESRTQASPFFVLDQSDELAGQASINLRVNMPREVTLTGTLTGSLRQLEMIRTLPLSAEFADAKQREVDASRLYLTGQWIMPLLSGSIEDRLTIGTDLQLGAMENTWLDVATGPASAFAGHSGEAGDVSTQGEASRQAAAVYAQYDVNPTPAVRITAGARFDHITSEYSPTGQSKTSSEHNAFSPKGGINVRYKSSRTQVGNWYANVGRSFKAPTLDQLYDQRLIPVPFPPFGISISNEDLRPQQGINLETGLYHRAVMASGNLTLDLTVSVYQMDMKDELDFQFDTFSYANISRSRHRGLEVGGRLDILMRSGLLLNYTLQDVTYRAGSYEGNYVKAVPRHFVNLSVSVPVLSRLGATAVVRSARKVWLDDANTVPLDAYSTIDVKIDYDLGRLGLELEAVNLLDDEYSTTGFLDPGGSDSVFLYPAAGRFFRLGIRATL